ncbi:MAG TPA: M20/M25/M40 family metallo-hydrolase [Thermoanaerobaculia bacterium]|nr:M20/M25/M40 family metallo-hydrolase [Thermoanaerobaculia bacterium]
MKAATTPRLYRANRTAARISLYSSLVLTTLFAGVFVVGSRSFDTRAAELGWTPREFERIEEVVLLQDYLRIDTTAETGSEMAGARYLADVLARDGIESEIIDMGERRANLIAVLPGESEQALVLHNHIDVDPIRDPEKWVHPPFSGTIKPPWIYGRGAFDMKSVAIAQLRALVELKRSGVRPRRSVVFLATSGEETGSSTGTAWLLRERADLLGKSWGVLTEGGVVEARTPTDIKYWGTENGQKRYVRMLACSRSRQRLETIHDDLRARGEPLEHLRVVPPVAEFLRYYASTRDLPKHRDLLAQPEAVVGDLARFAQLAQYQKTLFRDEISLLRIEPSTDGRGWVLPIVFGLLPDSDVEQAIADLLPEWITHGVWLQRLPDDGSAPTSPIDHPILVTIGQLLTERYGQVPNGPFYQTRSTNDARLFRRQGIPSYGFSPFLVLATDTVGVGGVNESLALPGYVDGVEMYVDLVRRLVGAT